jgi:hypothetical protein
MVSMEERFGVASERPVGRDALRIRIKVWMAKRCGVDSELAR